jgi:2-haloacid dehalogenase
MKLELCMAIENVRALTFDLFGTTVDWCGGVAHEVKRALAPKGVQLDWIAFTNRWRKEYQPAMGAVREGKRSYVAMDVLHREMLDVALAEYGVDVLSISEKDALALAWRRLAAWPDVVAGLERLKRKYLVVALSNANVALAANLAKHAGLSWDVILGSELVGTYKPMAPVYDSAPKFLDLKPEQVMMVACHVWDLRAAQTRGLRAAFVARPGEYGTGVPGSTPEPGEFDFVVNDFGELADALGA